MDLQVQIDSPEGKRFARELLAGALRIDPSVIEAAEQPVGPVPPAAADSRYRDWSLYLKNEPNNRCACGRVISRNRANCQACQ